MSAKKKKENVFKSRILGYLKKITILVIVVIP